MSPAANTEGTLVAPALSPLSTATLPRASSATPSCSSSPARTGPTKPIAKSSIAHGSSNVLSGTSRRVRPSSCTRTASSARTAPCSSPSTLVVRTAKSRTPPSSCDDDVRITSGHAGHGLSSARSSGGRGMSSRDVTLSAP